MYPRVIVIDRKTYHSVEGMPQRAFAIFLKVAFTYAGYHMSDNSRLQHADKQPYAD